MKIIRALAFFLIFYLTFFLDAYLTYRLSGLTFDWLILATQQPTDAHYRIILSSEINMAGLLPSGFILGFAAALLLPIRRSTRLIFKMLPLVTYYAINIYIMASIGLKLVPFDFLTMIQPTIVALILVCPLYLLGLRLGMPLFMKLQPIWIRVTRAKPAAPADTKEKILKEIAADSTL